MFKKLKLAAFVVLLGCAFIPIAGLAADATLDLPVNSAYLWRGQLYNDEPVFQPSLNVATEYGLSFNTWANYGLTDNLGEENDKEVNEVDLTLSYAFSFKVINFEVGVAEYLYPHTTAMEESDGGTNFVGRAAPGTRDAYISVGLDIPLNPALKVAHDFDEYDGFYAEASISHSVEPLKDLSLELSLSLGMADSTYNKGYFGVDASALNDGNAKLSASYSLSESLSLSGYVQYTRLLNSAIEDGAEETYLNDGDTVTGGASLSYSF